jgi:KipI family sensor histidine kinase inhibitor
VLEGFYLRFGEGLSEEANWRALALAETLLQAPPPGLLDAVPAYGTLYLEYDPRRLPQARLLRLLKAPPREEVGEGRAVEVPVRYDGEDLREVAGRAGLSVEAVKALHQKPLYRVYALGFTPGFPFMAPVEPPLRLPRRPHPRPRVPAHSVAVAGPQTGIYPLPSPGGWNLLGTSLVAVYDPHRPEPFLLRPGDRVRFREAEGPTPEEPPPLELLPEDPLLPAIRVEEAGLLDLVVDGGRFLAGRYGLARSGPLDPYSARVANALVGNPPGAPLLEVSLKGPVLTALRPLVAALAGYGLVGLLEGEEVAPGRSFLWPRGKGPPPPAQGKGSPGLPGGGGGPRGQALPGLGLPGPKGADRKAP